MNDVAPRLEDGTNGFVLLWSKESVEVELASGMGSARKEALLSWRRRDGLLLGRRVAMASCRGRQASVDLQSM